LNITHTPTNIDGGCDKRLGLHGWDNDTHVAGNARAPQKRKRFFFEKKNQKTFIPTPAALSGPILKRWGLDRGSGGEIKVFWFFSSEKNIFLDFIAAASAGR
jgi:hypothetical protein